MPLPPGAFDQRNDPRFPESGGDGVPLAARPDVLVFETEPLAAPLAIAGPVVVELFVSTDGPDTDFTAKLLDVHPPSASHPGGLAVNLTDGVARLRFRNGYDREELAVPGEVYRLRFELFPTACVFPAGHRLRLDVSSSNYPRFELNPNTGEPLGKHRRMRCAENTVHHSPEHPSAVRVWGLTQ
jgi:putative CocE/NonD family hydrolase